VLEILSTGAEEYLSEGNVVLIGDVNAQFGREAGPRGWGKTSKNGKALIRLIRENHMVIADLESDTEGPKYSFVSNWGTISYLDHCMLSNDLIGRVAKVQVHEEQIENPSDHLPLTITVKSEAGYSEATTSSVSAKVAWDKCNSDEIRNNYTLPLNEVIQSDSVLQNIERLPLIAKSNNKHIDAAITALTKNMRNISLN
jgi:hypothetical protein